MNSQRLHQKREKLEALAKNHPTNYMVRILLFTLLGFSTLLFLLLFSLGCLALLGYMVFSRNVPGTFLKLGIPMAIMSYTLLKSFTLRITPPEGMKIAKQDFPELFALIDEVREQVQAAPPHVVLLNHEMNAGVTQVPLLGLLGFHRRYLVIGIPLLLTLTKDEIRSILAHEFGHLSKSHSKVGIWIYRLQNTWHTLYVQAESKHHWSYAVIDTLMGWFMPRYTLATAAFNRQQEYIADEFSKRVVNSSTAAHALLSVEIIDQWMNDSFWSPLQRETFDVDEAPKNLYSRLIQFLQQYTEISQEVRDRQFHQRKIDDQLEMEERNISSSHPTIMERFEAFEVPFTNAFPQNFNHSYFYHLPGDRRQELESLWNEFWYDSNLERWAIFHEVEQETKAEYLKLHQQYEEGTLPQEKEIDYAYTVGEYLGEEAALPIYEKIVTHTPDSPEANFILGRYLLQKDDEQGIPYLQKALMEEQIALDCCNELYQFYKYRENHEMAQKYLGDFRSFHRLKMARTEERTTIPFDEDYYFPHGCSESQIQALIKQLSTYSSIKRAYLVQQKVEISSGEPLFLLGLDLVEPVWDLKNEYKNLVYVIADDLDFEYDTNVAYLNDDNRPLRSVLKKIPNSLIYNRKKEA